MIDDRARIFDQLSTFDWKPTSDHFATKLQALDLALSHAVRDIGLRCISEEPRVHLSFSGGVDSTLLLYKLVGHGFPVTAHTMAATEENPDLVHAREVVSQMEGDVEHKVHMRSFTDEDVQRSNRILRQEKERPDNYLMLMEMLSKHTREIISGDCIDELTGGYYKHQGGEPKIFRELLGQVIPNHLTPLNRCSSYYRVRVHLPYAAKAVLQACGEFAFDELVGETERKKPIVALATREGVPWKVVGRRKRGLVSALTGYRSGPAGGHDSLVESRKRSNRVE